MAQLEGPPAQVQDGGGGPASSVMEPEDDPVEPELDPDPLEEFDPEEPCDPDEEPDGFDPDEEPDGFDPDDDPWEPEEEPPAGAPESPSVSADCVESEQACRAETAPAEANQIRNHRFRMLLSVVVRGRRRLVKIPNERN
jgi:hypothetical protein